MQDIKHQFSLIFKAKHSPAGGVYGDIALDDYTIGGCKPSKGTECITKDFFLRQILSLRSLLPLYPAQSYT